MGFFSKKNKENIKPTTFCVSPKELAYLIDLSIQEIDQFQIEYEVEFILDNNIHIIGIDYDRENAPKKGYYPEYMSLYLDKQKFKSLEELYNNSIINGKRFCDFEKEFILDIVYKNAIETGDIIDDRYINIY